MIDWSNRNDVVELARVLAGEDRPQIVYKVRTKAYYCLCPPDSWPRRMDEFLRQDLELDFLLTVDAP